MLPERIYSDYDDCFKKLAVDPLDAVEISGWYCIAQWVCHCVGNRSLTKNELWNCLGGDGFLNALEKCSFDRYPIHDYFNEIFQLCTIIRKSNMIGVYAKFYYRDYLPCVATDTSIFDDTKLKSYYNGPVTRITG